MITPDYRDFQYSNELYHYGIPRRSGRYPYGSGERPFQSRKERRQIKKQNKQKKKLMRKLNDAVTGKEYNLIKKYKNEQRKQNAIKKGYTNNRLMRYYDDLTNLRIDNIKKYVIVFDSTLEKLKNYGIDLDDIEIKTVKKMRSDGQINTYWNGYEYNIKEQNTN